MNGWFNRLVIFLFNGFDVILGIVLCSIVLYGGFDLSVVLVLGMCCDNVGNESMVLMYLVKYDLILLLVSLSVGRDVDVGGWYNYVVVVMFVGFDLILGIDVCIGNVMYFGSDIGGILFVGLCVDCVGNCIVVLFVFKYDGMLFLVVVKVVWLFDENGWYMKLVVVMFSGVDVFLGLVNCI